MTPTRTPRRPKNVPPQPLLLRDISGFIYLISAELSFARKQSELCHLQNEAAIRCCVLCVCIIYAHLCVHLVARTSCTSFFFFILNSYRVRFLFSILQNSRKIHIIYFQTISRLWNEMQLLCPIDLKETH